MLQGKEGGRGSRRAAIACALVVSAPLALGVPALADPGGNGKGSGPESAPGQLKQEQAAAAPVAPRTTAPAPRGEAKGLQKARIAPAAKSAPRPAAPAAPQARPAPKAPKAQGAPKARKAPKAPTAKSHGPAGKTTLCHATGSATNPFVTITVSNNAVPAHDRHQNDEDIIPATAQCGGGAPVVPPGNGQEKGGQQKMTICHATGSATNPFVEITIALPAIPAHDAHQNDEDVIPATAGECVLPTTTETPPGVTPVVPPGESPTGAVPAPLVSPQAAAPENEVLGETVTSPSAGEAPGAVTDLNTVAGAEDVIQNAAGAQSSGAELPFTGIDLWVVALAGLALLLAGFAGRRALTHRS